MPDHMRSDFVRLTVLSLLVVTGGAVSCSGGSDKSATDTSNPEGAFVSTGSLVVARSGLTATLLSNGKVLMAGGFDGSNVLASAELYDPAAGTFTLTGSMTAPRLAHTAISLSNGQVLIVGGADIHDTDPANVLASAELYDPSSGTFTPTGGLSVARYNQTATLLPSGKALVAGGYDGTYELASAELYDPSSGTFTPTGSMTVARASHTASSLSDGTVLLTGGYETWQPAASAERYDPVAGVFVATGRMGQARARHTATLLQDGTVLITGHSPAELYDPVAETFADTGDPVGGLLGGHSGTLLPDGKVLLASGNVTNTVDGQLVGPAQLYDAGAGTFTATGNMTVAGAAANATLLPNGKVLIAGGFVPDPWDITPVGHPALASAELFRE
jgi:hypothetical protein